MIDMGMRENDCVEVLDREGKLAVFLG